MNGWQKFEKISNDLILWCVLVFIIFTVANIGALLGSKHKENTIIQACLTNGHYYTPKYNIVCTPVELDKESKK